MKNMHKMNNMFNMSRHENYFTVIYQNSCIHMTQRIYVNIAMKRFNEYLSLKHALYPISLNTFGFLF